MAVTTAFYREYPETEIITTGYDWSTRTVGPYKFVLPTTYGAWNYRNIAPIPTHKIIAALYRCEGIFAMDLNRILIAVVGQDRYYTVDPDTNLVTEVPFNHEYTDRYNVNYCGYKVTILPTKEISGMLYKVVGEGTLPPTSAYKELLLRHPDCTEVIQNTSGEIIFRR